MDYSEIHKNALAECDEQVSTDAVYIGAILFQLLTKKPCKAKQLRPLEFLPADKLQEVCLSLKGRRATPSEIFKAVTGEAATQSDANNTANQLRKLGYLMRRSNGRNLYHF
jgi:hypothetical protein